MRVERSNHSVIAMWYMSGFPHGAQPPELFIHFNLGKKLPVIIIMCEVVLGWFVSFIINHQSLSSNNHMQPFRQ